MISNLRRSVLLIVVCLFTAVGHAQSPVITRLASSNGPAGTRITILGTNFSGSSRSVSINNVVVTPLAEPAVALGVAMDVTVPVGVTSGDLFVTVNGLTSNHVPFTLLPGLPSISAAAYQPNGGGEIVTVTGNNFGAVPAGGPNFVLFGHEVIRPTTWTNTTLQFALPVIAGGPIQVEIGELLSNSMSLVSGSTTPTITWAAPADTWYGLPLSSTQLNATATIPSTGASVPGVFVYTPAAGSVLPVGTQTLSVTFTPTDAVHYPPVTSTQTIRVQTSPTTTKVTISPSQSWFNYPALVNVTVQGAEGSVPLAGGTIQCTVNPAPTTPIPTPAATLDGTTTFAQVIVKGLAITPNSTTYSVVCAFTSANQTEYTNSDSSAAPALGTVVAAPTAVNSAIVPGLITPRAHHQATLMADGTVLITGGVSQTNTGTDNGDSYDIVQPSYLNSAEIYNPSTVKFTQAAPMASARTGHQSTLLSNSTGQVLITGGYTGSTLLASAELFTPANTPGAAGSFAPPTLYDPAIGTFSTNTSQMNAARYFHTATLLLDGTVLITGGQTNGGAILNTAEIFDPRTGIFTYTGTMTTSRWMHTATLLPDGTVLIAGGQDRDGGGSTLNSAEVYIPSTHQFVAVGAMLQGRSFAQATLLGDGTVLVTGGATAECGSGYPSIRATSCAMSEAETYTSSGVGAGSFSVPFNSSGQAASMQQPRYSHTATVLYDGTVLISGGVTNTQADTLSEQELYDPTAKVFTPIGGLVSGRYQQTATLLPNSGVLLAGGQIGSSVGFNSVGFDGGQVSAEVYGATGLRGGLHPKYMILGVMYTPPGSGSTMAYSQSTMFGSSTNSTNSFKNGLTVGSSGIPGVKIIGSSTLTGNYTYALSGSAMYSTSSTTTDTTTVPGPISSGLGVDHESDIVWIWLNPETDYTAASGSAVVWNGYATNPNDPNVAPGVMDVVPLTVAQLDGTAPIPAALQEILDRNWDPSAVGGAGGLTRTSTGQTPSDFLQLLESDPFATNLSMNGQRSTLATNAPPGTSIPVPIFDPNIPTQVGTAADGAPIQCGSRYSFDPVNGQTFPFNPLGGTTQVGGVPVSINQPIVSTYAVNSTITKTSDNATTDAYTVGISASLSNQNVGESNCVKGADQSCTSPAPFTEGGNNNALPALLNGLSISDQLTFTNMWDPSKTNAPTDIETLIVKSPLPTDNYAGPEQMQIWRDNLYGSYMFYPKPSDTTVTLQSPQSSTQFGDSINLSAMVRPDPKIGGVPSGTVTFYDGCTVLGTKPLVGGTATINVSWNKSQQIGVSQAVAAPQSIICPPLDANASAGTPNVLPPSCINNPPPPPPPPPTTQSHVIRALYSGDATFFHNVGNTLTQVVTSSSLPYIASNGIAPSSGSIASSVVLTGVNFGLSGVVSFNGIPATTSSWSSTSIVAIIPPGATTGPVTVTTGSSTSNSVLFAVTQPSGASTTSTLVLSPTSSWAGYPVVASVQLGTQSGAVPAGTVSCTSNPSTGLTNSAGAVDPKTGVAQVSLLDIPTSPSSYTEQCSFTPSNSLVYSSSLSNSVSATVIAVPPPSIYSTSGLTLPRENHQATLLNDGTLLITGGDEGKYAGEHEDGPNANFLQSAEIYNGSTFVPAAEMTTPRSMHQATLLSNGTGQVLITGGTNWDGTNGGPLASAELFTPGPVSGTPGSFTLTTIYDPAAKAFTTTPTAMNTPRYWHTATLLPSGKVLIVGGTSTTGNYNPNNNSYMVTAGANGTSGSSLATAELYDPLTGKFTYTANQMTAARSRHTATLLADGTVLIAGGIDNSGDALNSAEIYNPASDTFTAIAQPMTGGRIKAQATRLGNGSVLITGGSIGVESNSGCPSYRTVSGCARNDAEIYNPAMKTFTAVQNPMNLGRYSHTATVLYDGKVLISGGITNWYGSDQSETDYSEEVFDPQVGSTGQFTTVYTMAEPRFNQTSTLLPSSGVLTIGGAGTDIFGGNPLGYQNSNPTVEVFSPAVQRAGIHPKFMVVNVMYAPPGSGSNVTYTNSTTLGTTSTSEGMDSNQLTISVGATVGIQTVGSGTFSANGGYTFAQDGTSSYKLGTITSDATTVPGPASSTSGVNHEADILWVWLNPENDITVVTPGSLVWNGFATNQDDPNVAAGEMDIVPLTVSQLDGTAPIPPDLQAILDRNWDPVSAGGAGGLQLSDLNLILQRDPFAIYPAAPYPAPQASTLVTNVPSVPSPGYTAFDPNVPVPVSSAPGSPVACSSRYDFDSSVGQTFQYAPLGNTNQPITQSYSLQSNTTNTSSQGASDQYNVGLGLAVCFGSTGSTGCQVKNPTAVPQKPTTGDPGAFINLSVGDTWTWGNKWSSSTNNSSVETQALSIKNPLPSDNYTGPVQMQVWKDNLYGTFMFYPKPADTIVALVSSQPATQAQNAVTLSANVIVDPSYSQITGGAVPKGSVTFYDGCTVIGTEPLVGGKASIQNSWAALGTYPIRAVYNGDGTYFHNSSTVLTEAVVQSPIPSIGVAGLAPAAGIPGTPVTISGQNFGTSGTVSFNGIQATTSQWTSTSITTTVPLGASTGPVVVSTIDPSTELTLLSNGVPFTINPLANTAVTTATLSPVISWSGNPVVANVSVVVPAGLIAEGVVSCTVTSSGTAVNSNAVAINSSTGSAQVPLLGLPTVPAGVAAAKPYAVVCTFTSSNSAYSGGSSSTANGSVTNSAASVNLSTFGQLVVPRTQHQANLLPDGTVLITGGTGTSGTLSSSEVYVNGSQKFSLAAPMSTPRVGHQATLLANSTGQVLVTGGTDGSGAPLATAELFTQGQVPGDLGSFNPTTLYDPTAKAPTSTVTIMNIARTLHTATLLQNGSVLLAGGASTNTTALSSAELYNPTTGNFTFTSGPLAQGRAKHTATLLLDGTVLLTGGVDQYGNVLESAEIYNPTTNSFSVTKDATGKQTFMITGSSGAAGSMNSQAVRLGSGQVLITGGTDATGVALDTAQLYNPATGLFTSTLDSNGPTTMSVARNGHTATLLYDNTVLVAGGQLGNSQATSEEIYDPITGDFRTPASSMTTLRTNHTAVLLPNADVLITGGIGYAYGGTARTEALPICPIQPDQSNADAQLPCGNQPPPPPPPPISPSKEILGTAELFVSATASQDLYPKFVVLNVLYAPPGAGSTMTYADQTAIGTTNSTSNSFSSSWEVTASATIALTDVVSLTPQVSGGHTFTQQSSSSMALTTTTTDQTVVPGAVAAGTAGNKSPTSIGVDHEADLIQIWLNPAMRYTFPYPTGLSSNPGTNPLVWNGYETNPNDPNVAVGNMDIVTLTVGQLDGTSPIPVDLQEVLNRDWDSFSGGAGPLLPSDFQTILARDPFATNLSLNKSPSVMNTPGNFFDPNIPKPIAQGSSVCSSRYSFDPILGQTFPFGVLGSSNQPLVQNYSLQSGTTNTQTWNTTDQYSVEVDNNVSFGLFTGNDGQVSGVGAMLKTANTVTMSQSWGGNQSTAETATQSLSIKNPVGSDNYTGPTQMQVWQDNLYGTFMFYPQATDTYVHLTTSQPASGVGDTIVLVATVAADPKVAAIANPPLVPTGTVQFYDGCTLLGPAATLNNANGQASLAVSGLATGSHNILAVYNGDSNFSHNDSAVITETVNGSEAGVPFIASITPESGPPGTQVTIQGANLGSSGTVMFNGSPAPATWTPNGIVTTVPPPATSGLVVVTTTDGTSNGVTFTVNQQAGASSTSVTLDPSTTWSGYPVFADVTVSSSAGVIPQGTVTCVTSPLTPGKTLPTGTLDSTGSAQLVISDIPVVPAAGSPVPFTVTCAYTSSTTTGAPLTPSYSASVAGISEPVPPATIGAAGNLLTPRENHQASLLMDGTVLITGGQSVAAGSVLSSAELYFNGAFVAAEPMVSARTGHQATVLSKSTGQVLITGGSNGGSALSSAELFTPGLQPGEAGGFQLTTQYDRAAQTFTQTPTSMTTARARHTATELTTGKVLVAGGVDAGNGTLSTAELFDPLTGLFTPTTGQMVAGRSGHSATLLTDGTVLIDGGIDQSGSPIQNAEIYNPITDLFTPTKTPMITGRIGSQATRLGSGNVLISGGHNGNGIGLNTAEIYDAVTGTFSNTKGIATGLQSNMSVGRVSHSAALLYDGTVLISGGQSDPAQTLSSQEIYDPSAGGFSLVAPGAVPRFAATSTTMPITGILIVGGENAGSAGTTDVGDAELYAPQTLSVALHPKYKVLNIMYAPPGPGSQMNYSDAVTIGTSTGTENTFAHQFSLAYGFNLNLGIFAISRTTTRTWTDTQDSSSTFATNMVTTDSTTVPGPNDQALGVDHESDIIWLWLNPAVDYTVTSPTSFVWNGFEADPDDPNVQPGTADTIPLSVSQLDGTSPISQAEWDILDRNWDPISSGGSGPITTDDFKIILGRDPFATNLSGVGRSTAPTSSPTGNLYPIFDPNIPTADQQNTQNPSCGNRYDLSPGFNMTFPYSQLGSINQPLTQLYSLTSNVAQQISSATTDTYSVALSTKVSASKTWLGWLNDNGVSKLDGQVTIGSSSSGGAVLKGLTAAPKETLTWTDKWTQQKNNATLTTQQLTIKSPSASSSDPYSGPEEIQVWKDNLYGTFMFYPKVNDTNWILASSQSTVTSGSQVKFTATVTADAHSTTPPSGTVTFYDGCTVLDTVPVDGSSGMASTTRSLSGAGTVHNVQAVYSGDANFYHNNANIVSVTVTQ